MKKVVVLTGAGISAESGISTFRDSDGLWEQYRVEDVATHEAWERNPKLVLDFYNARRKDVICVVESPKDVLAMERVRKYFPQNYSSAQIENEIVKMCEARYRKRTSRER